MSAAPAGARPWRPLAVAALCAVVVSGLGGALTDVGPWYRALAKPAFQPPDWLFGPAWTLIFGLCAWAGAEGWQRAPDARARRTLLALWGVNAALNVGWSLLFFHLRRPDWALFEVVPFWFSILAVAWVTGRYAPRVRWLLAPYLAWVAFATVLNAAIVRLNGPFA